MEGHRGGESVQGEGIGCREMRERERRGGRQLEERGIVVPMGVRGSLSQGLFRCDICMVAICWSVCLHFN